MTPKENFVHFLKKEPYEWTPSSLDQLYFHPSMIPDYVARAMVFEQKPFTGEYGGKDLFGVEWVYVPSVGGSMETGVLSDDITDWENFVKFPNLDDIDWEGCARENAEYLKTDKMIHSTIFTGYFERLISFVGFENASMALIDEDEQECVHKLFDKLTELYIDEIRRMKKYFNVDIVELHDDWGNQRSLMFSKATHEEMILPYIKRVADAAHEMGVLIEQHSCGKIESIVPNIIASGVNTWRGQGSVVDKKWLVENYGDQFRFGVDVALDEGMTAEQGIAAVKSTLDAYHGKDVWFVLFRPTLGVELCTEVHDYLKKIGHI